MGLSTGFGTSQKSEPGGGGGSGFPFTVGSARNGTSIDTAGRVVLGQEVGQAGNPATLLDDREIPTDGNNVIFQDTGLQTIITAGVVQLVSADPLLATLVPANISFDDPANSLTSAFGAGSLTLQDFGGNAFARLAASDLLVQNTTTGAAARVNPVNFNIDNNIGNLIDMSAVRLQFNDNGAAIELSNGGGLFRIVGPAGDYQEIDVATGNTTVNQNLVVNGTGGLTINSGNAAGGLHVISPAIPGTDYAQADFTNNISEMARLFFSDSNFVSSTLVGASCLGFINIAGPGGIAIASGDAASSIRFGIGGFATTDEVARYDLATGLTLKKSLKTAAPVGGVSAAQPWNFGDHVTAVTSENTSSYLEVSVNGVMYMLQLRDPAE